MKQRNRFWPRMSTLIGALMTAAAASAGYAIELGRVASGTAVDPQIVASDNTFGLDLFKALAKDNTRNMAISPLSVAMALQIAYNGASGTTRESMAQTLRLGELTAAQINSANVALRTSLNSAAPLIQVTITNSLWMHLRDNPTLPSFTQTIATYYGSTVADLSGAPANLQGGKFQALRIPYGRGRLSMLIVLPNSGVNLRSFIADITADELNGWISRLRSSYGRIALPRFT